MPRILARFVPDEDSLVPSATVRSFASVTHRGQPGVGMVAPAPVKAPAKKGHTSITRGQNDLALK